MKLMKYQSKLDQINSGKFTRSELLKLKTNAENMFNAGDLDAKFIVDAIDVASPSDTYMIFMGFCPDGDMANRLDKRWKAESICTFEFFDSKHQQEDFNSIRVNDLIVLKKREEFGKTMRIYGHGRVTGFGHNDHDGRFLRIDWSTQNKEIIVPLMGCNSTVNLKSVEKVEAEMPDAFFDWLGGKWTTKVK